VGSSDWVSDDSRERGAGLWRRRVKPAMLG
jgi:hypothetical protein